MATAAKLRSSFLELPAEIRDRIYSDSWASNGFIHIQYNGILYQVQHRRSLALPEWVPKSFDRVSFHRPLESLSFLLANKQVFQEALEELARNLAWRLEDGDRFGPPYIKLGMSGRESASSYRTVTRPSPQNFPPWRSQSLDVVIALQPAQYMHYNSRRAHHMLSQSRRLEETIILPSNSAEQRITHLVHSEPSSHVNIRHLSLTLSMSFDDFGYARDPYVFHLGALYALGPVLPELRTVEISLAPSPALQRSTPLRWAPDATYYKFGTVDSAGIKAATPVLLRLGKGLLGGQGVVEKHEGWIREMHIFRFEKGVDEVTN